MRLRALQRQQRSSLLWYLLGFAAVQLGLAVGVDQYWPAVRDPDFHELTRLVPQRQADTPRRSLILMFGSSRTREAFRAELVNQPANRDAPLVINCATLGGGPMSHRVFLQRFVDHGIRPNLVFVEIMPMQLSARKGSALEERQPTGKYSAAEAAELWPYFGQPIRLAYPWAIARALPCYRHQAELRDALALDLPPNSGPCFRSGRDRFGWAPGIANASAAEVKLRIQENLDSYASALTEPAVAAGPLQAVHDLLNLAHRERIPVVLVVPPEGSPFRRRAPEVTACHIAALCRLAQERGVPVIDTRTWIDDAGFYDGHHATPQGAIQYTQRFAKEALGPFAAADFPAQRAGR